MNGVIHQQLRTVGAAACTLVALTLSSCDQKNKVHPANPRTAAPALKPDPLLGPWIEIADNGGGGNGTIADFRPDGTVAVTFKGKTRTTHYRREPGRAWVDRRTRGGARKLELQALSPWTKPGVEMIEFADSHGKYPDYGSSLLTFDPDRRVLYNILTSVWCRPGDEARVKEQWK